MERGGCIYFMTNEYNTVLYLGVTSDLKIRIYQHKNNAFPNSFTSKYLCNKLVYFETFVNIEEAITREKNLKNWKRDWKNDLINKMNPEWKDLSFEVENW